MIQTYQDDFETAVENAESWMKAIHEKLKVNDNTQGPRSALEARLRETENICLLEPEGKLLIDVVCMKAEVLLSESSDQDKHEIHVKLGHIKTTFEETTTYMTHCHSRIEWVWLHWNEYLKARDEFAAWVHNMTLTLEPEMELQLGAKEKRWRYEQSEILLKDINNQSRLLNHLLDEAASLYNRIGDPSVDESVQNDMMAEYKQIKKKAQERLVVLEKIAKEHEDYEQDINQFQSWLNGVIEKLKCFVGGATQSADQCVQVTKDTEQRLQTLQDISQDVQHGRKQLEGLEVKSAMVIKNTSPLGAEEIRKTLEEIRKVLEGLQLMNNEEMENLVTSHHSESTFLLLAKQLENHLDEFRRTIQSLEGRLEHEEQPKSEEELITLWRTLNATKSALDAEEAKAEHIRAQLKDLFKFSKDVQPLSDGVIAAMRVYQRAKTQAFRLSTETESALRQHCQNPLREYHHWKPLTERLLDTVSAAGGADGLNGECLLQIEMLLEESTRIKDMLAVLRQREGHITSVLGEEKAQSLLTEVAAVSEERASLHSDLLARRNSLQSLASRSEEFDATFSLLQKTLLALRIKVVKENELQPDLVGKEAKLQRLQMLHEDLDRLRPHLEGLSPMAESNPTNKHRVGQMLSEYLMLQRSLELSIQKSKQNISDHRMFTNKFLDLQSWIMETKHKMESYQDDGWSIDSEERTIKELTEELSEKEIQLHEVEAQGQKVMENSSPEGAARIQSELKQLKASWESLNLLWHGLLRRVKVKDPDRTIPLSQAEHPLGKRTSMIPVKLTSRIDHIRNASRGSLQSGGSIERLKKTQEMDTLGSSAKETHQFVTSKQSDKSPAPTSERQIYGSHSTENNICSKPKSQTKSAVKGSQQVVSSGKFTDVVDSAHGKRKGEKRIFVKTGSFYFLALFSLGFQGHTASVPTLLQRNAGSPQSAPLRNARLGRFIPALTMPDSSARLNHRGAGEDPTTLLKKFEEFVQVESSRLNEICATRASSKDGGKTRLSQLQKLQARVPQGQHLFESLLQCRPSMAITENLKLEDLIYRWMLHKAKLRDTGSSLSLKTSEDLTGLTKKTSGGLCSFLHRVCCAALPLQLLLLFLLLLAFLLPFIYGTQNCTLSNNFARSFNLMLRYEKPPPT
ncbi:nesprin-3 [Pelodytes ibericus]